MRKKVWLPAIILFASLTSKGQTLFTYGNHAVDVKEFLRAYKKTQPSPAVNKEKSIREYLGLYINSKLKIREALDRGYDTLASFKEEIATLRNQVTENYMSDTASLNTLIREAFLRSQKDIRVAHIFIPFTNANGVSDSALKRLKINEALMELKNGKSFEQVALKYSEDPSVQSNKGDLGFLTVFSLPYEFENLVYNSIPGKITPVYKSKSGYHIFKNNGVRKSPGKIKAAQILFALPPGIDPAGKEKIRLLADSVHRELLKGADFATLARKLSNDYMTSAAGGEMQAFMAGTYDPAFENAVFGLTKNGAISRPFLTAHGYHIVKRISVSPIPPSLSGKATYDDLRSRVEKDPRANVAKELLYQRIIKSAGFTLLPFREQELWWYADSILDFKTPPVAFKINHQTPLFRLGDKTQTVHDFITYAMSNRSTTVAPGIKPHEQLLEEFKRQIAFDYYREHLEEYNSEFRNQMLDFREGNLFFEIMMKDIWAVAQNDTTGQRNYYTRHKNKYIWKSSADAVLFYCSDEETAKTLAGQIKKNPAGWKDEIQKMGERVTVDSGRFEISKLPGIKNTIPKNGAITAIEKNKDDNSASFAYILKVYTALSPKTFTEARADIITDYQNELEAKWLAELKRKYPVRVNEVVLRSIIR